MNEKRIYRIAYDFLLNEIPAKNPKVILDSYLAVPDVNEKLVSMREIYKRILSSAQNSNMKANVIGGSIGGFKQLGKALFTFDHKKTLRQFHGNPDALLKHIVKTLRPKGEVRREAQSIWPKYCRTILSTASFLSRFENNVDFYAWANSLYQNTHSMPALPLILAAEIEGVGYTLACDFLKELGFLAYGKPDRHVVDIFVGTDLCEPKPKPYDVQKIISRIAHSANVSPYNVDKLFWLIGSGKFHKHKTLGKDGFIGRRKKQFILEFQAKR